MRRKDDFKVFGAFTGDDIVGYVVFESGSGDITQLAVDKAHRRKGLASTLLAKALERNRYNSVKLINAEVSCESINAFLEYCDIPLRGKQFERIKKL
jgi:ribosomal protein S18 acetylase RimI-like enzyme